jgi:hypothetical protein
MQEEMLKKVEQGFNMTKLIDSMKSVMQDELSKIDSKTPRSNEITRKPKLSIGNFNNEELKNIQSEAGQGSIKTSSFGSFGNYKFGQSQTFVNK